MARLRPVGELVLVDLHPRARTARPRHNAAEGLLIMISPLEVNVGLKGNAG